MDMKYYIAILCAVTVVAGSLVGAFASADDSTAIEDIAETVKMIDMGKVVESMEARGFDVTVDGDMISAYKEGYGRTVQITVDCPDGQCQVPNPHGEKMPCNGAKKHFRFKMHGTMTVEAIKAKMAGMGYSVEDIDAKITGMQQMKQDGYGNCPFRQVIEQGSAE